jgi:hypothetical protein
VSRSRLGFGRPASPLSIEQGLQGGQEILVVFRSFCSGPSQGAGREMRGGRLPEVRCKFASPKWRTNELSRH